MGDKTMWTFKPDCNAGNAEKLMAESTFYALGRKWTKSGESTNLSRTLYSTLTGRGASSAASHLKPSS